MLCEFANHTKSEVENAICLAKLSEMKGLMAKALPNYVRRRFSSKLSDSSTSSGAKHPQEGRTVTRIKKLAPIRLENIGRLPIIAERTAVKVQVLHRPTVPLDTIRLISFVFWL
jgi:hypothetical protein